MRQMVGLVVVLGVFLASLFVNVARATVVANSRCVNMDCGAASQSCPPGGGACFRCGGGAAAAGYCTYTRASSCNAIFEFECGTQFPGYCLGGICSGSVGNGEKCYVQTCAPS